MEESIFLQSLEELLELNPHTLRPETMLSSLVEWDSLAAVSFLAMTDAKFHIRIKPNALEGCNTVRDLMALVTRSAAP